MNNLTRVCSRCRVEKPATPEYFGRDRYRLYGIRYECKVCQKAYRDRNREHYAEYRARNYEALRQKQCNSWAFHQLRAFLLYKSIKFGVRVHLVDPRYTSKSCHCCGVLGSRNGKSFRCLNLRCGWRGDADWNGSLNIAKLGASINRLGGPSPLSCSLQDVVLRATENSVLKRVSARAG